MRSHRQEQTRRGLDPTRSPIGSGTRGPIFHGSSHRGRNGFRRLLLDVAIVLTVLSPMPAALAAGCPGTINFDNGAGTGLWQTAANWDTNTLPAPADDVCIAGFSVTLSSGTHPIGSLSVDGAGSLALAGGTLDLASASQIDGSFVFSSGVLSGGGNLTVNGLTTWSDGLMSGTGRTKVSGGMTLAGGTNALMRNGRVLEVPAGATVTMSSHLYADVGAATIENSGTWNVTNDSNFNGSGAGTKTITNLATGILRKTGGTGVTESTWTTLDNAGGTVEVQSGELRPQDGTHTGAFLVSAGTLNLRSTTSFNAGSSVTGPGEVQLSAGGTASFNAGSSYAPGGLTRLVGGTLNLATGSAVAVAGLTMSGNGAVLGGPDTVNVTGMTTWSDGLMSGTGRTKVSGGMTLAGGTNALMRNGRVLEVPAGATVTMSQHLYADVGAATIENSGTWNVTNDSNFNGSGGGTKTITNLATGILRKTGGAGVTEASWTTLDNTGGTVEVQSGELRPNTGTHTGPFMVSAGTLNLRGTTSFNAGSSVTGPGEVQLSAGGTASFTTGSSYAPGGLTRLTGGTLNLGTGSAVTVVGLTMSGNGAVLSGPDSVDVTGTTTWSDGLMSGTGRTKVSGGMTLAGGTNALMRNGRVLEVPAGATVTMSQHLYADVGAATIENSGTWNVTNDSNFNGSGGGTKTITNLATGILRKTGGAGVTEASWTTLDNTGGTVEVQSGELRPNDGTHTGPFLVSAGTLNLRGTTSFNAGSSVTGSGEVQVSSGTTSFTAGSSYASGGLTRLTGGTLNLATGSAAAMASLTMSGNGAVLSGPDTVDVAGMTTWSDGLMSGTGRTKVSGGMTLAGGTNALLRNGRVLEVPAGATVTMSQHLYADVGAATIENSGTWNVTNDSSFNGSGGGTKTITNLTTGILRKSAGAGTSSITWDSLSNAGTVEALAGTLQVPPYTQTAGTTAVDGATLSSSSTMNVLAGFLRGVGTISTPSLASSGELSPAGPARGILGVSGAYAQSAAGRYRADIGGLTPGSGHDQVNITGAATLGGELAVNLVNGFAPSLGDSFTPMTFASRGGTTFATFTPSPAPCGLDWNLVHASTSVVAQIVAGTCPDDDADGFANCCHPACSLIGGDTCGDCNDDDAGANALPLEATGLLLGSDKVTLSWTSVIPPSGSATVHDVVTGLISELPVGSGASESCLGSVPSASTTDAAVPPAGDGLWYLVRGRNSCGAGTYGMRSNGSENVSGACP